MAKVKIKRRRRKNKTNFQKTKTDFQKAKSLIIIKKIIQKLEN